MDGLAFSLTGLLFTDLPGALVFLVAVFFVSVVAMLKNFLPHWLSDHNGSFDLIRRTDYWWRHPSTLRDGEVTQKRSKAAVDCVKIRLVNKNMK